MSASEKPTVGKPAEKASTSLRRAVSYRGEEGATREARGVRGGRGLGARACMHALRTLANSLEARHFLKSASLRPSLCASISFATCGHGLGLG